jgi:hypothetical protein
MDVPAIAREYSAQKFPDDPVVDVDLPGLDGALFKAPAGKEGLGNF